VCKYPVVKSDAPDALVFPSTLAFLHQRNSISEGKIDPKLSDTSQ
jgi:hypothetical protein